MGICKLVLNNCYWVDLTGDKFFHCFFACFFLAWYTSCHHVSQCRTSSDISAEKQPQGRPSSSLPPPPLQTHQSLHVTLLLGLTLDLPQTRSSEQPKLMYNIIHVWLFLCRSFTYPNPNRILKQPNSPLQAQVAAPGPVIRKWNTLDNADRVYSVGRDEKTYSQAFTKKMLNSSGKSPYRIAQSQSKRERERGTAFQGQSLGHSSEAESETMVTAFSISLEGHGLERGAQGSTNGDDRGPPQQRKKQKKPELHGKNQTALNTSMFSSQEGSGRPTIERGGTNTILMEISGVGSRSGTSEGQALLSQNTKESIIRKKQRYQSKDDHELLDKKPQPSTYSRMASDEGGNTPGTIASAPVEMAEKRNKHKKTMEGHHHHHHRTSKSHFDSLDTPKSKAQSRGGGGGGGTLTITDMDTSLSSTGGSSPQEQDSVFIETQVHSNPEQAIKAAHQSMASEDWSSKCEGMTMLMCAARHYPNLLLPQLHSTLLAVQKEVRLSLLHISLVYA